MQLTEEQYAIIHSQGNIKINAVAGSGKTTTLIEYAKSRAAESKILYLAFNKSVKLEAIEKFKQHQIRNVSIETAHSLAYKYVVRDSEYKLRSQGYKNHEIVELLGLEDGFAEKHTEYIIAYHINEFISFFCNSDKSKVQELNYLDVISDEKTKTFVNNYYKVIVNYTRQMLAKMNTGEIEITHDFYLKKFQLLNPQLPYDYILFDEGQDASGAMLDVFLKQKAVKVIVGDTHQQIYNWRYAVNSLEKTDFTTYQLSQSFRFSPAIANLAMKVLDWKNHFSESQSISIFGKGKSENHKSKVIIARSNLGLLLNAIETVTENTDLKNLYFEGNINSYTYAKDGASLYDVLNLSNGNRKSIKDNLIKQMDSLQDLKEYIEKTNDVELKLLVEIVKKYGNNIRTILATIKEKHVENDNKKNAEIVFSTVHRCKGMEYDSVELVNDFISEEKLEQLKLKPLDETSFEKLNEEINLLYVAVTRTKNILRIPENLLPKGFPESAHIQVLKSTQQTIETQNQTVQKISKKTDSVSEVGYFTKEEDFELTKMFFEGFSIKHLANHFERPEGVLRYRIYKLKLV